MATPSDALTGGRDAELRPSSGPDAIAALEEQLRASEQRFRSILDQASEGIFVADASGHYVEVNATGAEMLGYTREEILRLSLIDVVAPDEAGRLPEAVARLRDGQPVTSEWRFRRKDGTQLDVELLGRQLPDSRLLGYVRDVTERKHTEELLRRSEERYRLIVENQTEFIVKWRPDGTRTFVNQRYCQVFGVREEACVGTSFFPLVAPEHREMIRRQTAALSPASPEYTEEHRSIVPGGERWQQWTSRGIFDESGHLVEILSTGRDITDRVRLEEQLRQSQKMQAIGQLAGGVAHDFNNLLTVINGHVEMLLDGLAPDDATRGGLLAVRDAGERAALLTRQLLLFSRKAVLEPKVLDCGDLVQRTSQMLRRLISEEVSLATILAPSLARIKADPSQIEQVIMNLALNACDAMPLGGRLTLETRNVSVDAEFCRSHPEYAPGKYVQLVVADTGCGMTPHVKAHLFEPFFTTKGPGRGTGLGLATVYGIVQESGGFVTVASEVDAGATFSVFLPALEDGEPSASATDVRGRGLVGRETVLLVEDDPAVRRITRLTLEKYGYTVLEAGAGDAALRLSDAHTGPIDILVSDVVMPGMGGRRVADELATRRPHCRVLFMSGYTEEMLANRGAFGPAEGFIQKPFAPVSLAEKVREVLDRRLGGDTT
jgi:PAS domain S-box-containing protein